MHNVHLIKKQMCAYWVCVWGGGGGGVTWVWVRQPTFLVLISPGTSLVCSEVSPSNISCLHLRGLSSTPAGNYSCPLFLPWILLFYSAARESCHIGRVDHFRPQLGEGLSLCGWGEVVFITNTCQFLINNLVMCNIAIFAVEHCKIAACTASCFLVAWPWTSSSQTYTDRIKAQAAAEMSEKIKCFICQTQGKVNQTPCLFYSLSSLNSPLSGRQVHNLSEATGKVHGEYGNHMDGPTTCRLQIRWKQGFLLKTKRRKDWGRLGRPRVRGKWEPIEEGDWKNEDNRRRRPNTNQRKAK